VQNVRSKLRRDIERYRLLQRNISSPALAALLQEMIAEATAQLAILDAQWRTASSAAGHNGSGGQPGAFEAGLKAAGSPAQRQRRADWRLDQHSRSATLPSGKEVRLTKGEFELLFALLTHSGQVLSREDLMMLAQSRPAAPGERTIDVLINRLRRKLEIDPRHPTTIKTVRSEGYVFQVPSNDDP